MYSPLVGSNLPWSLSPDVLPPPFGLADGGGRAHEVPSAGIHGKGKYSNHATFANPRER